MRKLLSVPVLLTVAFLPSSLASAHVHEARSGHQIANGQAHPGFPESGKMDGNYTACDKNGVQEGTFWPSWYGIETAHHGPDANRPGLALGTDDPEAGCYSIEGGLHPTNDLADRNPGIE